VDCDTVILFQIDGASISNASSISNELDINVGTVTNIGPKLSNIDLNGGILNPKSNNLIDVSNFRGIMDFSEGASTNVRLVNCDINDTVTFSTVGASVTNCNFSGFLTIDAVDNKFSNCYINSIITIATTADDTQMFNCNSDSGIVVAAADDVCISGHKTGTATTITVDASSNRTRIVGCATDSAIVDNGTGTVVAANTVF
jgi:hypothetical protein